MDDFLTIYGTTQWLGAEQIIASLLICFLLSSAVAAVYRWTFQSLSYSRSFIHTMILASMAVSMIIMTVGNSLARGLGILGSLAIVRFRTPVRDTRDMTFLFICLGIGVACGSAVYGVAIIGSLVICVAAVLLHWSPFASRRQHEALLRYVLPPGSASEEKVKDIMRSTCSAFSLIAVREIHQGDLNEYCYQVRLLDPAYQSEIVSRLGEIEDLSEPNLLLHRSTVEL
ncbi:MAG: DUF4956 domain-containing protein [Verrucomicrobiae bacterium]|jgi:uncharacterized membrane protein YhiD involved in acid resistance|nr:DUF4956 domain-containing protein [Verrucomicrobiae bacterium]